MKKKFIFHNFTNEEFTAYWDGKPYTFPPGAKQYYVEGIASVFAKHLANRELIKKGLDRSTSPKKPSEVPLFKELYDKAFLIEDSPDINNLEIEDVNTVEDEPSMNINVKKKEEVGKLDTTEPEEEYVKPKTRTKPKAKK